MNRGFVEMFAWLGESEEALAGHLLPRCEREREREID